MWNRMFIYTTKNTKNTDSSSCFVDKEGNMIENKSPIKFKISAIPQVTIPQELAERLAYGEINLAELIGLKRDSLYKIAEVGYRLFMSEKYDQAKQIYQGLIAADPYDSVFHCHLAAIYHRLGDLDKAMHGYTQAIKYNFADIDALAGRGEVYYNRGKLLEAFHDLKAAIELDPEGKFESSVRARAIVVAIKE